MPVPHQTDLVAVDVGGANLKAADGRGWTRTVAFPLWREWQRLPEALAALVGPVTPRRIVATMTGEIADCYPSRAAGVSHIVDALVAAAAAVRCGDSPGIYLLDGRIVSADAAKEHPLHAAASNWHALSRLAAAHAPTDRSLLIDVGSTTVDVVPIIDGTPAPRAHDDAGRLLAGELIYTGVERTPLAAVVRWLPHHGLRRPVAAERVADSRDAWLLLGSLPERPDATDTADGGPATRDAARIRLARSLLLEPDSFTPTDAEAAAAAFAARQARLVARAIGRVVTGCGWRPTSLVIAGHGEQLARMAIDRACLGGPLVSLPEVLGADVSRAAPAHALALIARGVLA
ncbi:MAG: hydantoinase/oxoprolinase family protein [Planctomycetaceae bacterium]